MRARSSGTSPATGGSTGASPSARRFDVFVTARGIAVSPDGRTLALTHSDGAVDLIDTRTLRRRASVRAIDGTAASVAFSPDGRLLAVTGEGGRLTLWNARTLAPAGELRGMRGHSQALAFSPDGKLLAAAEAVRRRAAAAAAGVGRAPADAHRLPGPDLGRPDRVQPERRTDRRGGKLSRHGRARRAHGQARQALRGRGSLRPGRLLALRGVLAGRRPALRRPVQRHGAPVLDRDLEAGRPAARGSHGRGSPSRSSRPTAARWSPPPRTAPWCSGTWRPRSRSGRRWRSSRTPGRPPSSAPTARACTPSPRGARESASTCPRRPGSATPAWSPGASSPRTSGSEALPERPYQSVCSGD